MCSRLWIFVWMFTGKRIEYKIFWLLSIKIWCNNHHIDRSAAICSCSFLSNNRKFNYFAQYERKSTIIFTKPFGLLGAFAKEEEKQIDKCTIDNWLSIIYIEFTSRLYLFIEWNFRWISKMINRTHHTHAHSDTNIRKYSWCCIDRKQISINSFNSTLVQTIFKSEQNYKIQRIFKAISTVTIAAIIPRRRKNFESKWISNRK